MLTTTCRFERYRVEGNLLHKVAFTRRDIERSMWGEVSLTDRDRMVEDWLLLHRKDLDATDMVRIVHLSRPGPRESEREGDYTWYRLDKVGPRYRRHKPRIRLAIDHPIWSLQLVGGGVWMFPTRRQGSRGRR